MLHKIQIDSYIKETHILTDYQNNVSLIKWMYMLNQHFFDKTFLTEALLRNASVKKVLFIYIEDLLWSYPQDN
jgi:hypothetical protein